MDPSSKKQQPTGTAAASTSRRPAVEANKPTTLLDAYEVERIRRELESLLLKQKDYGDGAAAGSTDDAAAEILGLRRRRGPGHHHGSTKASAKNSNNPAPAPTLPAKKANPAPAPALPAKKKRSGGGARLLGRHAVALCSGAAAVSSSGASAGASGRRRPRRAGYREVEKV